VWCDDIKLFAKCSPEKDVRVKMYGIKNKPLFVKEAFIKRILLYVFAAFILVVLPSSIYNTPRPKPFK
jgi:hypothetical protein